MIFSLCLHRRRVICNTRLFKNNVFKERDVSKYWTLLFFSPPCSFIADNQMNQAIMLFTENRGAHIIRRNLCRNFLLHLVSMHDFNLVSTATIDRAMARLRQIQEELPQTEGEEPQDPTLVSAGACNGNAVTCAGGKQGKRTKSALTDWWRMDGWDNECLEIFWVLFVFVFFPLQRTLTTILRCFNIRDNWSPKDLAWSRPVYKVTKLLEHENRTKYEQTWTESPISASEDWIM